MTVTAQLVKELREITGAGMMDCKRALVETGGNIEEAVGVLREKGLSKAAKKAGRIAAEGLVDLAFSADHKEAAIIEVNSETDFAAKNPGFIKFVSVLAEKALKQDADSMDSFMALPYDENGTVKDALVNMISKTGENINIRRFEKLASDGVVYTGYIHTGGKIAVIAGIKTEAAADEIASVGKDVAMQIASMNPKFVDKSLVNAEWLESEKEIAKKQLLNEGKKPELVDRIVPGKIKAVLKEVCLADQKFVKNSEISVEGYVNEEARKIGKAMKVVEMARYEVGEGIEKKSGNFAEEVASIVK